MRKHFIDNLRWADVLLLVPYHAAMAWNVWEEPNYIFFGGDRVLSSFIVFLSPWFMPLLFLLAGISTRYALEKRSLGQYIRERAKRLLVPLCFGTLALMPVMTWLADRKNCGCSDGFFAHYRVFFTRFTDLTGADGGFSLGQFWFLLYLFVISVIAAAVIALRKKRPARRELRLPFPVICLLGAPLPLLDEVLSVGGKSLAAFLYIFLVGYYVFSDDAVAESCAKYRALTLTLGLSAGALNVYLFIWAGGDHAALNTAAKYLAEWLMLPALIGLGKRRLDRSGRVSGFMSARSFPFFSFHFIWVVVFQYALADALAGSTALLFLVPVLLGFGATFACSEVCIRVPLLCFLTGTKRPGRR